MTKKITETEKAEVRAEWEVQMRERMMEHAEKQIVERMDRIIDDLQRTAEEMKSYRDRIAGDGQGAAKEDLTVWAINCLENAARSFNYSSLTRDLLAYGVAKQQVKDLNS